MSDFFGSLANAPYREVIPADEHTCLSTVLGVAERSEGPGKEWAHLNPDFCFWRIGTRQLAHVPGRDAESPDDFVGILACSVGTKSGLQSLFG